MLVGAILLAAGALRLGFIGNFISESVLTGFKAGIGVVIVLDQLPKLLGVHIEKAGFFRDIASIVAHLPDASGATVLLALFLLALIFVLERFAPWAAPPLVAIAVAIAASAALGLREAGVATVGEVPRELPALRAAAARPVAQMWPAAAGIALMSFAETIAVGRAFAAPGEPRPAPNRELLATGLASAAGGLIGALPAGGGATQTAVNRRAGAKTQLAALVTAGGGAGDAAAARAAHRAHAAGRARRGGRGVFARADQAGGVPRDPPRAPHRVPLGADRLRRRDLSRHAAGHPGGGDRLAAGARAAGLQPAGARHRPQARHRRVPPALGRASRRRDLAGAADPASRGAPVLRQRAARGRDHPADGRAGEARGRACSTASAVLDIEYTALKMLAEAEERLRGEGVELWLAGCNPEVLAVVRNSKLGERLGRERMFFNVAEAVERYENRTLSR